MNEWIDVSSHRLLRGILRGPISFNRAREAPPQKIATVLFLLRGAGRCCEKFPMVLGFFEGCGEVLNKSRDGPVSFKGCGGCCEKFTMVLFRFRGAGRS